MSVRAAVGIGPGQMGHRPLDPGQLLVVVPALVGVSLGEGGQLGRPGRIGPLQDGEAGLGRREVRDRDRRLGRVELERLAAFDLGRLVPVERPVATLDGIFWWLIDLLMSIP